MKSLAWLINDFFQISKPSDRILTKNLDPLDAFHGGIEHGILPLVEALNKIPGTRTIASCHGHGRAAGWFFSAEMFSRPYVLFHENSEFARLLAEGIEGGRGKQNQLNFVWKLQGYFYPHACQLPATKRFAL